MPELAEVEFYKRKWRVDPSLRFERIFCRLEKRVYRKLNDDPHVLENQNLLTSYAHGKQMLFEFSGNLWLGIHLGMTGSLHVFEGDYAPTNHDHLVLYREDSRVYVFRDPRQFGLLLLEQSDGVPRRWSNLPPQILDAAFTQDLLNKYLLRHPKAPIKSVLLKQQYFPGIGNWMADEVLFQSKIHPQCPGRSITSQRLTLLYKVLKSVCGESLRIIAPNWGTPPDSWLFTHRWKDGGICPLSGCRLERVKIGGRTTCYSPQIQL